MATSAKLRSKSDCIQFLHQLGVRKGSVLLVHQGASSLWPLNDSVLTLMTACLELLGEQGTLCALAFYPNNCEPRRAIETRAERRAELSAQPLEQSRSALQNPFFTALSLNSGSSRVDHPRYSLCAVGKYAKYVTHEYPLDFPFGLQSCFRTLYEMEADYLLLDVGLSACEELKLAFAQRDDGIIEMNGSAYDDGNWHTFLDYRFNLEVCNRGLRQLGNLKQVKLNDNNCSFMNYAEVINAIVQSKG